MNYYEKIIQEKRNAKKEKDNSTVKSEVYKGYIIDISSMTDKGKIVGYEAHIADKNYKQVGWELWFKSVDEAIRWGKSKIDSGRLNSKEEKGYYTKLVEEKNSNPYYIALSLIKDKHSINDMIRELTSNYGATKAEALKAIEKAAKDLHDAEVESKVRSLY